MHILALQQTKPSLPSVTITFMLLLKRLSFFLGHLSREMNNRFLLGATKFISVELLSDGRHDL